MNNTLPVLVEEDEDTYRLARLTGPQSSFYKAKEKYPLFVGGFGSGKSTTMSVSAATDLINYPGANIGAYAPTYDLLKLITEPFIIQRLHDADLRFTLNKSDHIFYVSDSGIGDIYCRSLSNPERIIGYEVFRSHVDELDTLRELQAEAAWNAVIARNRQKIYIFDQNDQRILRTDWQEVKSKAKRGEEVELYQTELNRVSAYTTPEGFRFAHKRWVKEGNADYGIYRASTYSNPHLPEGYIDGLLSSYPDQLIRAYLRGEFVNLNSSNVYKGFNRIDSHSDISAPFEGEVVHIGMDFNVEVGASVAHVIRDEQPVAISEVFNAYDTEAQIAAWDERYPNNPIHCYPDASGNKRSSSNSSPTRTDLAMLTKAGYVMKNDFSNPLIRDRVNCMNAQFCNGKQVRSYKVNTEQCPQYTDALEQIVWDDNGIPDKSSGLDHITEAGGYFIAKRFPIIRVSAGYGAAASVRRRI